MSSAATLKIGGCLFRFSPRKHLSFFPHPGEYSEFLDLPALPDETVVSVEIDDTVPQIPDSQYLVFDSGPSWRLYRRSGQTTIAMMPPEHHAPIWTAELAGDMQRVAIHVNPEALQMAGSRNITHPFQYPLDQILMMIFLADLNGLIVHGAGIAGNGKLYLFAGASGAGKSTLSKQFARHSGWSVISDDRIIVRRSPEGWMAYGTPWPGEFGAAKNVRLPLAAVLILEHADVNAIRPLQPGESMKRLFPTLSIPWFDRQLLPGTLDTCSRMLTDIPVYRFAFRPEISAIHEVTRFVTSGAQP